MRPVSRLLLCLISAIPLLVSSQGAANDAPLWLMGGGASPKSAHSTIRMDSEDVTIRLNQNTYTVDAIFHFFNTGETTSEWVGFPKRGQGSSGMFDRAKDFKRFETWVNGRKVQFSEEKELFSNARMFLSGLFSNYVTDHRWLVKQVTFSGRAVTTTRVSYEAEYYWGADARVAYYIYGTGSYWKDSIGKAVFTIDGNGLVQASDFEVEWARGLAVTPKVLSKFVVTYELKDFEPDPDARLKVLFSPVFVKRSVNDDESVRKDSSKNGRRWFWGKHPQGHGRQ